jgi:LmbE family N-acetylglucosaminyl deacetylase
MNPVRFARARLGRARDYVTLAREMAAFGRSLPTVVFDESGPVLVLSPHLDDAVLDCWSVLASSDDVRVVNVFAGVPPSGFLARWDAACGAVESADQISARIAEDAEVLAELGRQPANLPFLEIQYGARRLSMQVLDRAIAAVVPRASSVYAPAALSEGHVDHRLVRSYARTLARAGLPVRLYGDLPYGIRTPYGVVTGWPAWVRETPVGYTEKDIEDGALRGIGEVSAVHVATLDGADAARKLRAMRGYRSQIALLDRGGRLSDPAAHRHEIFWSLQRGRSPSPSRRAHTTLRR